MMAIETRALTKVWGKRTALDSLDLSVKEGELFALLGTNGAGKTTTIKLLSTLISPTSGSASVLGHDIMHEKAAIRARINISPQTTAIAPNLTVMENLRFFAGIYAVSDSEAMIADLIETFSLHGILKQPAKTLSGGWARKLSIAASLISSPDLLFLDEPTLGLDVLARKALWESIAALKGKITIILTTHYMEEAARLADRVGILHKGKLAALGTVDELLEMTGKSTLEDAFTTIVGGDVL